MKANKELIYKIGIIDSRYGKSIRLKVLMLLPYLNTGIGIKLRRLERVGRGTPEFTPVEIEPLLARASSIGETGSPP